MVLGLCHVFKMFTPLCLGLSIKKPNVHTRIATTKQSIAKSPECYVSSIFCLVAIVTMRRTEHRETVGRKPLSSKMRKKLLQRRASRSHKQQKPQPPPRGNAAEPQAAKHWTWVLQLTTPETRAQRRRYSCFFKSETYFQQYAFSHHISLYSYLQSSVRQSSSSGLADLLVIDPSSNQGTTTGNYKLKKLKKKWRLCGVPVSLCWTRVFSPLLFVWLYACVHPFRWKFRPHWWLCWLLLSCGLCQPPNLHW